jgi:hypothetical protein
MGPRPVAARGQCRRLGVTTPWSFAGEKLESTRRGVLLRRIVFHDAFAATQQILKPWVCVE